MGAVLHTLNIRLFAEQLVYVVNHAQDKVILVDGRSSTRSRSHVDQLETVEHYVVMGDGAARELPNAIAYEELLARQAPGFDYPAIDDRAAAGSATRAARPATRRASSTRTARTSCTRWGPCLADGYRRLAAPTASSRSCRCSTPTRGACPTRRAWPARAWSCPSRFLQAEPLARLIERERVTVAGAVPTIWLDVLRYSDEHKPDLSSIRVVACGGSAVPRALMEAFEERHGMQIIQAWGMTETSPLASVAHPPAATEGEEHWGYRSTAGRLLPLVRGARSSPTTARVAAGTARRPASWRCAGRGSRGPTTRTRTRAEKFDDGWLRTGDVASIDARRLHPHHRPLQGRHQVRRRVDLLRRARERADGPRRRRRGGRDRHADERWSERPLACVVLEQGRAASAEELQEHLASRVAKWWLPEDFAFIDEVPKTSVGKFDKKVLRKRLEEGELETVSGSAPASRSA